MAFTKLLRKATKSTRAAVKAAEEAAERAAKKKKKTAPKPKQAIEKSQGSAGLLSYIAVGKYADSLPLYRQSNILSRFGIEMNPPHWQVG